MCTKPSLAGEKKKVIAHCNGLRKVCLSEGSFHHFIFILCVNRKGKNESIIVSIR